MVWSNTKYESSSCSTTSIELFGGVDILRAIVCDISVLLYTLTIITEKRHQTASVRRKVNRELSLLEGVTPLEISIKRYMLLDEVNGE